MPWPRLPQGGCAVSARLMPRFCRPQHDLHTRGHPLVASEVTGRLSPAAVPRPRPLSRDTGASPQGAHSPGTAALETACCEAGLCPRARDCLPAEQLVNLELKGQPVSVGSSCEELRVRATSRVCQDLGRAPEFPQGVRGWGALTLTIRLCSTRARSCQTISGFSGVAQSSLLTPGSGWSPGFLRVCLPPSQLHLPGGGVGGGR